MFNYNSLLNDIKNLGIKKDDKIIIHSSLKKVGQIQGGGDTLLDTFCSYLGEKGLVVLPCHTWGNIHEHNNTFDIDMPSNLGVLPNLFRVRNGVYRSMHPTHSVCAFGLDASEFVQGEIGNDSYCGKGCMEKLLNMGGKVLLVGVSLTSCTFFHLIEEQTLKDHFWFNDSPTLHKVKTPTGEIIDNPIFYTKLDTSEYFDKALDVVKRDSSTRLGKIGNADCILLDMQAIYKVIQSLLQKDKDYFMHE